MNGKTWNAPILEDKTRFFIPLYCLSAWFHSDCLEIVFGINNPFKRQIFHNFSISFRNSFKSWFWNNKLKVIVSKYLHFLLDFDVRSTISLTINMPAALQNSHQSIKYWTHFSPHRRKWSYLKNKYILNSSITVRWMMNEHVYPYESYSHWFIVMILKSTLQNISEVRLFALLR